MSHSKLKQMVESDAAAFLEGEALATDPWDAPVEDVVMAWQILDALQDRIEAKKIPLRERLMEEAEQTGVLTSKNGYHLMVDDAKVVKERRESKLPDEEELKGLLLEKELLVSDAFSRKVVWVMDPSKIENLVNLGKLHKDEVDELHKVSWALKVEPSPVLDALLAGFLPPEELEEEVPVPVVERPKRIASKGARMGK